MNFQESLQYFSKQLTSKRLKLIHQFSEHEIQNSNTESTDLQLFTHLQWLDYCRNLKSGKIEFNPKKYFKDLSYLNIGRYSHVESDKSKIYNELRMRYYSRKNSIAILTDDCYNLDNHLLWLLTFESLAKERMNQILTGNSSSGKLYEYSDSNITGLEGYWNPKESSWGSLIFVNNRIFPTIVNEIKKNVVDWMSLISNYA